MFTRPFTSLGWIIMPLMLIYGLITPLTYVIIDAALLLGIASGSWTTIVLPVLVFILVDMVYAGWGMYGEKNWYKLVIAVPLVRFVSRYIAFSVLVYSFVTALEGSVVSWNKVMRTGGVRDLFAKMSSRVSTNS